MIEKTGDVPDRLAIVVRPYSPIMRAGVEYYIGQKKAVAQTGEVVDVGRRSIAGVNHPQAGLGL